MIIQPLPTLLPLEDLKTAVTSERSRYPTSPKYADLTTLLDLIPRHVSIAAKLIESCTPTLHIHRMEDGDNNPESIPLRARMTEIATVYEDWRFPKGCIAYIPESGIAASYAYNSKSFLPVKLTLLLHDDALRINYDLTSDFVRRDEYYHFRRIGPKELFSVFDCFIPVLDLYKEFPIRVFFQKFEAERADVLKLHTTTIPLELAELIVLDSDRRRREY